MIDQCLMESKLCNALKNNKDTSLEIKLVDMLCECSWYVLNILMVLFIMALKKGIRDQLVKCSKSFRSRHVGMSSISSWCPGGLTS